MSAGNEYSEGGRLSAAFSRVHAWAFHCWQGAGRRKRSDDRECFPGGFERAQQGELLAMSATWMRRQPQLEVLHPRLAQQVRR